jgi:hypothetical protein
MCFRLDVFMGHTSLVVLVLSEDEAPMEQPPFMQGSK